MLLILLKSSACLAVFMLFYKLCLEKTSVHTFKRFYLIAVILISIGIPFITFTEYIEVNVEPENFEVLAHQNDSIPQNFEIAETKKIQDYLPSILWVIYGIGCILFAYRFFKNLYQLINKIKQNPKYKHQSFINVLIQDLIIPHTFLNYIFLNKTNFDNKVIPQEILLHEQAHAKQKHSLDILFIEILQILFWFNPLLYFIKKDIKLNHEFLADQVVLNNGFNSKNYQQLLLAFSSNASHSSLANAINYSLIKKRFTVMKTQTSKQAFWLRSFILLPLLAFLIYSFSDKDIIEKPIKQPTLNIGSTIKNNKIKIFINNDRKIFIESKEIYLKSLSKELKILSLKSDTEPSLNIHIEGHVTYKYLKKLVNEIKKVNTSISNLSADTFYFDEIDKAYESTRDYFKETIYSADSIRYNITADKLKKRISDHKKLNPKPKTTQKGIDKKSNLLVIKIIDNETVFINNKKCALENFESHIVEIIKDLSPKEKAKLTPITVFNTPDGDKTSTLINNILKKHKLLRQEQIVYLEPNTVNVKNIGNQQKATLEEINE